MMKAMPEIKFNQDIPKDINQTDYRMIVFDDLMPQSGKDKLIVHAFTKGYHHRNLSVIFIVQNILHQGKEI